ncbi:hypothetical protein C5167_040624, partial [Papaver somniferum]
MYVKVEFLTGNNQFTGPIPRSLRNCTSLRNITGTIPSELGKLKILKELHLSSNNLVGEIHNELFNLSSLIKLKLRDNKLSGRLPFAVGKLSNLLEEYPNSLGIILLDLSYNELSGEIPSDLRKLNKLIKLNLSHNKLFGSIPSSFDQMFSLTTAFEDAPIDALKKNKGLCSNNSRGLKPCYSSVEIRKKDDKRKVLLVILLPLIGSLYQARATNTGGNLFSIWNYDGKIVFEDIIEATEDFDTKYCVVAVKKLHSLDEDSNIFDLKSFESEVRALTKIRHRNIVKLFGFCSNLDRRMSFLVYEFVENISLRDILDQCIGTPHDVVQNEIMCT